MMEVLIPSGLERRYRRSFSDPMLPIHSRHWITTHDGLVQKPTLPLPISNSGLTNIQNQTLPSSSFLIQPDLFMDKSLQFNHIHKLHLASSILWKAFVRFPYPLPHHTQLILRCLSINKALIIIQKHFRRHRAQKQLKILRMKALLYGSCHFEVVTIQLHWRRYQQRDNQIIQDLIPKILQIRNEAAIRIQTAWRKRVKIMQEEFLAMKFFIMRARALAATDIQRIWRGYKTRKVLDQLSSHWVIRWIWDSPRTVVEVVGDFSNPPWTKRHLMKYCPILCCFVLVVPRVNSTFELKFIVDGRYVCDGSEATASDGNGHYNNIFHVKPVETSPFKMIRNALRDIEHKNFLERSCVWPLDARSDTIESMNYLNTNVNYTGDLSALNPVSIFDSDSCNSSDNEDNCKLSDVASASTCYSMNSNTASESVGSPIAMSQKGHVLLSDEPLQFDLCDRVPQLYSNDEQDCDILGKHTYVKSSPYDQSDIMELNSICISQPKAYFRESKWTSELPHDRGPA